MKTCEALWRLTYPLTARLIVDDVVVLLDREQGGRANIEARGKRLHSVLKLSEVIPHADIPTADNQDCILANE